jgi:integrase
MPSRKRASRKRFRVGRVSLYLHHGAWWLYYRDGGQPVRRRVAQTPKEAERVAAQVNAQLTQSAPTLLAFVPIGLAELRQEFFNYHEYVLRSSLGTIRRYRAATQHLENFAHSQAKPPLAHEVRAEAFTRYLRSVQVSPNGHPHTARRHLRDRGIQFILETCRALYSYAARRRNLPPYAGNPFAAVPVDKLKIEDAKPIFVFDADTELAFFRAADAWAFAVHFVLSKTGLRVGELTHLLVEDVDWNAAWLHIRNKRALGWRVKTGSERDVPLLPEVVTVLRRVVGDRRAGPVFLRKGFAGGRLPPLVGDRGELERTCAERQRAAGSSLSRTEMLRIAGTVWRDAGAVKAEAIRTAFLRIMRAIGRPEATCPKSWRHTFATLLQAGGVDPLIRQLVLGHKPTTDRGLGMTTVYTHPWPWVQRQQVEQALRQWPQSLALAGKIAPGD